MADMKIVVVYNATGRLGASVTNALARAGSVQVRAVASRKENESDEDVSRGNVENLNFDLQDRSKLLEVLQNADACFINTVTDLDDPSCMELEIAEGCFVADACKSANVKHVIFSSQLHSNNICSIMARHLVAKAEIEKYMRDIGLPLTCIILPVFYEDLCGLFLPRTTDGRCFDIEIPMGTTPLDMISLEDVGQLLLTILGHRQAYLNKTVSVCGDKVTIREIAQVLTRYLSPKTFTDKQITTYEFHQKRSRDLKGSADWANMFRFFQRVDQRYNLSITREMNPSLRSFKDWVMEHTARLSSVFEQSAYQESCRSLNVI